MNPPITVGRIVHYKLTAGDLDAIKRRRVTGAGHGDNWPPGAQAHVGNWPQVGDSVPFLVVKIWEKEYGDQPGLNGQVFLDGNDVLWATSIREGTENGQWSWPPRV